MELVAGEAEVRGVVVEVQAAVAQILKADIIAAFRRDLNPARLEDLADFVVARRQVADLPEAVLVCDCCEAGCFVGHNYRPASEGFTCAILELEAR